MATEIIMPRLSDSMEEGTILTWLVAEGDEIAPGQGLVEVETDKATVVHEADMRGVVLALTVGEGASVPVGAPIAIVGERGEELPRAAAPEAVAAVAALESGAAQPGSRGGGTAVAAGSREGGTAVAAGGSGAGGGVAVAPGGPEAGGGTTGAPAGPETGAGTPRSRNGARVKASPLARRLAAKAGISLDELNGSGPLGRVIRSDVQRAIASAPAAAPAPASGSSIESLSRLQQTVARRMTQSRQEVPDIELRVQVDMTQTVAVREQLRGVAEPLPSLNDFVVKAAAVALREFPRVNAAYRENGFERFERVNVGIAVAGEDALLVPVLRDADRASLGEIARGARELAQRARDGSITPAQLDGATFTVSNLGMFGVDSFSAVINQPQAAILTVGSLAPRPVVDESGAIVARPTVTLTLVCDHRILYGADGARFLARLRELLEAPLAMLVG